MAYPEGSIEWMEKLVSYDTSSYLSNLELIEYIRGYLKSYDIEAQLAFNEDGTKANLYATVGPLDKPGIMLSGHSDVVPVTGQNWSVAPFDVLFRDDKYYGRGTCDMKGFIAIVLASVPRLMKAELQTPIHLAFSYDEEIGCVGVRKLLDMMQDMPIKPAMCVVGEPTSMKVVTAHKGKIATRVHIKGLEAHSSLPHIGVNTIDYAAELIVHIRRLAQQLNVQGPYDEGFEVNYTTIHVGKIRGGTAVNIIPSACSFEFEIRNIPGQQPQPLLKQIIQHAKKVLEPQMQEVNTDCGFEFEPLSDYPGLFTPADAEVVKFVSSLTEVEGTTKITFGTEGGLFTQRLGIPTVVCGPGSIKQAHKPDEYIALDQVQQMERFMDRLIEAVSDTGQIK